MWEICKWLAKPKLFTILPFTEKFTSVPDYLFKDICIVNGLGSYTVSPSREKGRHAYLKTTS